MALTLSQGTIGRGMDELRCKIFWAGHAHIPVRAATLAHPLKPDPTMAQEIKQIMIPPTTIGAIEKLDPSNFPEESV